MKIPRLLNETIFPDMDWQQAFLDAAHMGDERPTWAYDWPAGLRLADALAEAFDSIDAIDLKSAQVCDLGCGRGMLGLCALQLGAAHVSFCDGSEQVLRYVEKILAVNQLQQQAHCHQHQWGTDIPQSRGQAYDLILGGDILYRPECFADIFASIATSLATQGTAILSDPREELEQQIPELAAQAGLHYSQQRYENFTTLVLSHHS